MDNQFLFVKHYLISHRRYLYLIGLLLSSLVLFAYIFEGYRNFLLYLTGCGWVSGLSEGSALWGGTT